MVSPKLIDYIQQQVAAGVSKEEISKSLIAAGWQVSDVNEALNSTTMPSPSAPPPNTGSNQAGNRQKFVRLLLLVLVALLLAIGAYVYTQTKQGNQPVSSGIAAYATSTTETTTVPAKIPNNSDKPTITADRTNVTFGDTVTFTLNKYPANAARFEFSFNCSADLSGKWIGICNESASYYPDNQSTTTRQKMIYAEVLLPQTATAELKAYDKYNNSLGKSTISLIIEPNASHLDRVIKTDVLSTYAGAELRWYGNNSYTGVCNDTNVVPLIKELKSISNSVVCKDSAAAWALSAQMKSNPSQYFCMYGPQTATVPVNDINGVMRNSAITTTSCR